MDTPLANGIRTRTLSGVNGLDVFILEAGHEEAGEAGDKPLLLLLHGFPELAYSWRKVMPALAAAGFWIVAPDLRGYGKTTGWAGDYDGDITPFGFHNLVRDQMALLAALNRTKVHCVIGHDFGAPLTAWCALIRPDIFPRAILMSAPFGGPPGLKAPAADPIHDAMLALPRPRKHYQWYYSTRSANADMLAGDLTAFFRAYYHVKSADWSGNQPEPLAGWTAEALAALPTYYIMDAEADMAETVAPYLPSAGAIENCQWLPPGELAVYVGNYAQTGFQGGLNWYRNTTSRAQAQALSLFAGRTIDVPTCFIAGRQDWGIYQFPGAIDRMKDTVCSDFRGCHLIDKAGHWVQQEQPHAVTGHILAFLDR